MKPEEKLKELRNQGKTIYSHSRLNTFHQCEFEYYNTYVLKKKGINNVYTELGTCLHDNIEAMYDGSIDINKFKKNYEDKLIELEMLGIKFPSEVIRDSWVKDMDHFVNNFKKLDRKITQEQLILFEIAPDIYLQGYIDGIVPSEKGKPYVDIIDWKTSSKFSGKKLEEAGRQLIMYKLGLEAMTPFKVDKVMWSMLKYINVCWLQKNGKVKRKMCNRGKWVKEIRKQLEKDMGNLNLEGFEIELLLDQSVEGNTIDCLPKDVKDKYWLEDCFVEYEITEEKVEDFKNYVMSTIHEIENKNKNNEDDWEGIELNKYNSFYCSNLCGHRKTCHYYKEFLEENADSFEKKEKKNEFSLENLFG